MENSCTRVCVTGGSGYIGSWLVKKLLERGYTVHATLRNLEDKSKVGLLKSLPKGDTNLVLFQAEIYNPSEFEAAINGCDFVFHVATPLLHNANSSQGRVEATVAAVKSIADACLRSQTVKRLIYTASVTATSPILKQNEDGFNFKSCIDESCWTPLDVSFAYADDFSMDYTKAKTLAEKEVLRYNEIDDGKLDVVSLACGLVAGDTILPRLSSSLPVFLSQITGNLSQFNILRFLQEVLGSVPVVHIEDVCEAHIFCIENASMIGRFLCAVDSPSIRDISSYFEEHQPELKIDEKLKGEAGRGIGCDLSKLKKMGFEYKYDMKKIVEQSLECGKRYGIGALSNK